MRALPSGVIQKAVLLVAFLGVLALPFIWRPPRAVVHDMPRDARLPERKLVIISPHWEGVRTEFARAFSDWTARRFGHTTKVEWLDLGGTSDAIRYVRSEFTRAPQGINIDLFFGGGVDPFLQLVKDGLLSPCHLPDEVLKAIPQKFGGFECYDAEQRWFGACLSGFGIIFNKKVCQLARLPEPRTWEDMGRPAYFTWIGSGDPRSSGSVHMVYEIILQAYGWERGWANIVRMGGNTRNFSRSASEVPKDCAVGEVVCGMCIDVYAWRQVAEAGADRMGFHLPEGLTAVNPDGIAVLKGAPERELAERFVEFVLSKPGLKLWVLKRGAPGGPQKFELGRMSIIPGFAARLGDQASVTEDPYKWKTGFLYDANKGSLRWTILNDLLGAVLIDTHSELAAAWGKLKDLPADDPRVQTLIRAPCTEDELLGMAKSQWNDPAFRAATRGQWSSEAKARYKRLAGGR